MQSNLAQIAHKAAEQIMALDHPTTPAIDNLSAIILTALRAAQSESGRDSERIDTLRKLMGYTQDGSHQTVKLFEDDATFDFCITAGNKTYYSSGGLRAAIDAAAGREA